MAFLNLRNNSTPQFNNSPNIDEIDKFIRENWEKMSDKEMADKNGSPYGLLVLKRRGLNLKRPRGRKFGIKNEYYKFDRSKINKEEIIRALNIDGFTVLEFIKMKGWNITRQGLYLVLNDLGIDLLIKEKRIFFWYINRYVKIYPQLLDEDWLKKRTRSEILKELKIKRDIFGKIKKFLNLNTKKSRKTIKIIKLTCNYCGKQFKKRFANYKQAKDRGQENFYCKRSHYFAYLKENKKS